MFEALEQGPVSGVLDFLHAEGELLEAAADEGVDEGAAAADSGGDAGDAGAGEGAADGADAGGGDLGDIDENVELGDGEALSGAKLWNATKAQLATLDPKHRAAINKAIHQAESYTKAFPGGVEKATATLKSIETLANEPGQPLEKILEETGQERAYFRDLDKAYTEGKQEFVEKLFTAKPESFDKLAPMIFGKYSESNPDGYGSYIASTVLSHAAGADVPLNFKVLATFLPQLADGPAKDRVIEAVEAIYGWQQQLHALAAKKPAVKEAKAGEGKPGDDLATREQQVADRELNVTRESWNTETLQDGVRMVYAEADRFAGKQKLSGEERKKVLAKVGEELDIRLAGNKDYGKAMQGYLKSGNKTSYAQRLQAERKKLIPGAARRAVDDVIAERKAATAKAKPDAGAAGAKPAAGVKPAAGAVDTGEKVEWIAGYPTTQNLVVDLNRTSHQMLTKKRAYIKGRDTPVAWK